MGMRAMATSSGTTNRGFPFGLRIRSRAADEKLSRNTLVNNKADKSVPTKGSGSQQQQKAGLFYRLIRHHGNTTTSSNINSKSRKRLQKGKARLGGLRKSTSTHLTMSMNKSSVFLNECLTMEEFLLAEELDAFEERAEEGREDEVANKLPKDQEQEVEQQVESEETPITSASPSETTATITSQPQHLPQHQEELAAVHRMPAPESYYQMTKNGKEELGNIHFEFDSLEEAQREATRRQQPILCIEAESPRYLTTGGTIFSHPLVVEAAESLFVTVQPRPLEPQDDDDGASTRRSRFFTNSSCRTRVRILDDVGSDVLPPVEHMTIAEVVAAMVLGLELQDTKIPKYLQLFLEEESGKLQVLSKTRSRDIQRQAVFGMFDAVQAEVVFAGLSGVLSTRAGSFVRQQAVQVTYDSRRLSYCALVRHGLRHARVNLVYHDSNEERIAATMEVQRYEESIGKIQQRYADPNQASAKVSIKVIKNVSGNMRAIPKSKPALRGSILKFVPLTDLQATQANRLIHLQQFHKAMHLLSPRQGLIAMQAMQAHRSNTFEDVVDVPICTAWNELSPSVASPTMVCCKNNNCSDDDLSECPTEDPTEEYEDELLQ